MKHIKALFMAIGFLMVSCGGNNEVNTEPSVPSLVYPTNDLLCIENTLEFRWNTSLDAEGDGISYQIEVALDDQFSEIVYAERVVGTTKVFSLEKGRTFFWRVNAVDDTQNQSGFSASWSFHTAVDPVENLLPYVPELLNPSQESTIDASQVNLEWEATDPDLDDSLVFDLYFGTNQDPPIIETNLSSTSFTVNLSPATTYYWKVTVNDGNGGITVGPIWTFSSN